MNKLVFTKKEPRSSNGFFCVNLRDKDYAIVRRIASECKLSKAEVLGRMVQFCADNMELKEGNE